MTTIDRSAKKLAFIAIATVIAFSGMAVVAWNLASVEHSADGNHSTNFIVDCDYEKFRQIMVRKNATRAMIDQVGMKLIDETMDDLQVDTSGDERPLLNAIRGKSKSDLSAVKRITVELNDPAIDATELKLEQHADVGTESMMVETKSTAPAGNLKRYQTNLTARGDGVKTIVEVEVRIEVVVKVPKMFTERADDEVQRSAKNAVEEQEKSLKAFVAEHADQRLILPELK
ncbi:hypothetical protein FHS27_005078 [Rhodopirellula rubra]|uniref:Uncharacterized protein n=1 Tax=Aporhodopirellula rubra TaxID=980271 RepID=A0A7W5E2X7_9BACT|nr:hypothetical protein [Aporhodopirellula rubra]MBB3209240.1 hypothetical protein [Aporhodopirellula rubra]